MHAHMHTRARAGAHTHARTHTHAHAHTHTHTLSLSDSRLSFLAGICRFTYFRIIIKTKISLLNKPDDCKEREKRENQGKEGRMIMLNVSLFVG